MSSKSSSLSGAYAIEVRQTGTVSQGCSTGESESNVHLSRSRWIASWASVFLLSLIVRLAFLPINHNNTTDAWSRLHNAQLWLQNPGKLPPATAFGAWLPLHFWLLGIVLSVINSATTARVFTVLLGTLTVIFCAGIWTRAFGRRIALASSLVLALFGFHIAYSTTTSSEAPTIFFLAVGIYGWIRYNSEESWLWLLVSALALDAASLCRFEVWLVPPLLSLMSLDLKEGWSSLFSSGSAWRKALRFGLLACSGAVGWLIFSFLKWGDPLELPHKTMWLNTYFRPAVLHHSMVFRLFTVPGALLISLSPLLIGLVFLGLRAVLIRGHWLTRALALVVVVLLGFNWWNSIRYEVTQARYTLLYSWLLIPFAFEGLRWMSKRQPWAASRAVFAGVIVFFVLWQAGIIVGASYAPPSMADRLGVMSPTLPLHHEMRGLTNWLKSNSSSYHAVVLDDFNWESSAISRFGKLDPAKTLGITAQDYDDPSRVRTELAQFVSQRHPDLLICSPYGLIGKAWSVDDQKTVAVEDLGILLDLKWQGERWRIYTISYRPLSLPDSPTP